MREALLDVVRRRQIGFLHIGLPCKTWGPAGRLAGGSRRLGLPLGAGHLARERQANGELDFALTLCAELVAQGGHFSLENPDSSYVFHAPGFAMLTQACQIHEARLDQCMFGLTLPGQDPGHFCRKRTRIVSSMPRIVQLSRRCSGVAPGHAHTCAWGRAVVDGRTFSLTAAAGTYPRSLCLQWAQVVFAGLPAPPIVLCASMLRSLRGPQPTGSMD